MKRILHLGIIVLCLFFFLNGYSQTVEVGSLEITLKQFPDASIDRADILNQLSYHYYSIDVNKSYNYAKEASDISYKLDYKQGIAESNNNLAICHWIKGNNDSTFQLCQNTITIYKTIPRDENLVKCLNLMAIIYDDKGDYATAAKYYFDCIDICEEINDTINIGKIYNNIGLLYYSLENYIKAAEYALKGLQAHKKVKDSFQTGVSLQSVGDCFVKLDSLDRALEFYYESYEINKRINNLSALGYTYQGLAAIFDKKGDFEKASEYHKKGFEILSEYGSDRMIASSYILYGTHFLLQENYVDAIKNINKAHEIAKEVGDFDLTILSIDVLHQAYSALLEYEKAYTYFTLYQSMTDSLRKLENIQNVTILEKEYEFKLEQEKFQYELNSQLHKEKSLKNYFLAAFILVSLSFIAITYGLYQKVKSNKLLRMANETRDKMFRVIAHDFRSPLISISNLAYMIPELLEAKDFKSIKEQTGRLEQSVTQVLSLIDGLINWTLSQSKGIPYNPQKYNLLAISKEIVDIYLPIAQYKKINLDVEIDNELYIESDRNIFHTILRNLINNAIKFTPESGNIQLRASIKADIDTESHESMVYVSVTDNGKGIETKKLKDIFSVNVKAIAGTKGEKGDGLGLFFCKEFVQRNKGEIFVESEIGKGTTFTFSVPMAKL